MFACLREREREREREGGGGGWGGVGTVVPVHNILSYYITSHTNCEGRSLT